MDKVAALKKDLKNQLLSYLLLIKAVYLVRNATFTGEISKTHLLYKTNSFQIENALYNNIEIFPDSIIEKLAEQHHNLQSGVFKKMTFFP